MSQDFLQDRKNALEESFFAKENAKLLQQMRDKAANEVRRKEIQEASGISDPELLDEMLKLGLCGETVAALSLVPLVEVAWADGNIDAGEQEAIIEAAEKHGLPKDGPVHQLLENWLSRKPEARMLTAWKSYAKALASDLSPEARETLRHDLMDRARAVAEAAGGFLGFGKISKAERKMLEELDESLR